MAENNLMDKIVSLAKRRGFVFPGSEIYGGLANTWDYGPLGDKLKNNIKQFWRKNFIDQRDDVCGLDAAIIMNPKVWEASGHLKKFVDPLVECKKCKNRFRADKIENKKKCPNCGGKLSEARLFNTMLKTFFGAVEDSASEVYLRPETAQAIFVNFKNILDTVHPKIPFGIAQTGKAFRNEITPGNFIFRTREFEQMEIEYFIKENEWEKHFEYWIQKIKEWLSLIGIKQENVYFHEIPENERAHYSKRTVDIEYKFPFGQDELYGLAYRGSFDLSNHQEKSGVELTYEDPFSKEKFIPHVIEPSFGVDRTFLAVLAESYQEQEVNGEKRIYLSLKPELAPYKIAVFPLLANKLELVSKAKEIYQLLKKDFVVAWDDIGNIGKRYRRQDEIGTPYCITVDFDTLKDNTVTVRNRDTMEQERVNVNELKNYLNKIFSHNS